MAVVWAREHWEGRDGSFENTRTNQLTRTWKVKTDNKYDTALVLQSHFASALSITYYAPHPLNAFYTARRLQFTQESDSPYFWRATCTYSTEPLKEDEDEPENPLERPVRISGSSELVQVFTTKDQDGKPMLNSAGDPLRPLEVDDVRGTITAAKNFAALPSFVFQYPKRVNSSSFTIPGIPFTFDARTVRCSGFRWSDPQVQNDVTFVEVAMDFSVNPDTWDIVRLDEGVYYLSGSTRTRIMIDGEPAVTDVPLDGGGGVLVNPDEDNAVYRTWRHYPELDFNTLFAP